MLLLIQYLPPLIIFICTAIHFFKQRHGKGSHDYRSLLVSLVSMGAYLFSNFSNSFIRFGGFRISEFAIGFLLIAYGAISGRKIWSLIGALSFSLYSAALFLTGRAINLGSIVCLLLTAVAFYQNKAHKQLPTALWIALAVAALIFGLSGVNLTLLAMIVWFSPDFAKDLRISKPAGAPNTPAAQGMSTDEKLAALENLQKLLSCGVITKEEFDAKKKQLFSPPVTSTPPATQQTLGKCFVCERDHVPVESIEVVLSGMPVKCTLCSECAAKYRKTHPGSPPRQNNTPQIPCTPTTTHNAASKAPVPATKNSKWTKLGGATIAGILIFVFLAFFAGFDLNISDGTGLTSGCADAHSWNAGVCERCSMNCIEEIGKIIMDTPDQVTADNAYVKSYLTKDLCPSAKEGDLLYSGALGVGYLPESKTLVLEFAYHGGAEITQMIAINGAVAKYYTYQFRHDNRAYGGSYDYLSGQFNANTLKDTTSFSYTEVDSTVPDALKYFIDTYQEEACNFTKLLVKALNGFCGQNNLPFNAHELGFTQLTDSE